MLGFTGKDNFPGTLFRFPLRTPELAEESDISKSPYTEQSVHNLIASFKKEAPLALLFLKYVESIKLYYWAEGEEDPEIVYSVELADLTDEVRALRKKMIDYVKIGNSEIYEF
jgi:sacsin